VIDLHSHIAWGYDDGAVDEDESMAMARVYVAQGVTTVAATPHVAFGWATPLLDLDERCAQIVDRCRALGLTLELVPSAEVYLMADTLRWLEGRELGCRPLGASRYVLTEFNLGGSPNEAIRPLGDLIDAGWRPILAHAERYQFFWRHPDRLAELIEMGVSLQVTNGSLLGEFGSGARQLGERLIEADLTAVVASDAHHAWRRRPTMAEGRARVAELVGEPTADRLCHGNPAAILANESIAVTGDPAALMPQKSFLGALT